MRGFRFRSSLKKSDPCAIRRSCPPSAADEAPRRTREKNVWYPGYGRLGRTIFFFYLLFFSIHVLAITILIRFCFGGFVHSFALLFL